MAAGDGSVDNSIGQGIGLVSPLLSAIPIAGPILSAAGAVTAGLFENAAAQKQKQQGINERNQANQLQPEAIQPQFLQKLNYDQQTAAGGLPGMQLYKNYLAQQTANHMRAIQSSSPSGATSVNAISQALYGQNDALGKLGIEDAGFRTNARQAVSEDFSTIGVQQRALQMWRDQERDKMLGTANALAQAGTGNQQTAINTITGALGSTGAGIFKNLSDPNYLKYLSNWAQSVKTPGSGGATGGASSGSDGNNVPFGYQYDAPAQSAGALPNAPGYGGTQINTIGSGVDPWGIPFNQAGYATAPQQ